MTKSKPTKIIVKGEANIEEELPLQDPGAYDVFIVPGMLIERTTAGKVKPHATAAGAAAKLFALEMPFIGVNGALGEGRSFDDPYTEDGETVRFVNAKPGTWINALLRAGTGGDAAIGVQLASNGDGTLKVSDTNPVARAVEAIDNDPGTGGAAVRILVEVL
jgi:hypothetical protein